MTSADRFYWLAFSVFPGIGPKRFHELLAHFGSAKDAWHAPKLNLTKLLGEKLAEKLDRFRIAFSVDDYAKRVHHAGVSFITLNDEEYSALLKQIDNPPFVLFVKGNKDTLLRQRPDQDDPSASSGQAIAVVGTRRVTSYGKEVTALFTKQLVDAGFTIVSGLAMGVDAVAHKAAIDSGGKTIAVLGCGVDCCYPITNQYLYDEILNKGSLIISEYPIGQKPSKGSFPSRNRIIAGLSQAVLVTEGAEDSGSLITAQYALSFGRKVFAVPGPITSSLSKGPYELIRKGAKLVTGAGDILKEFKTQPASWRTKITPHMSKVNDATKEELEILKLLENEALHFDEIVRKSGFGSAKVGMLLSMLEMKGALSADSIGLYQISS